MAETSSMCVSSWRWRWPPTQSGGDAAVCLLEMLDELLGMVGLVSERGADALSDGENLVHGRAAG